MEGLRERSGERVHADSVVGQGLPFKCRSGDENGGCDVREAAVEGPEGLDGTWLAGNTKEKATRRWTLHFLG